MPFKKSNWTSEEKEYLKSNFPSGNLEEISKHLNRSINAINIQAVKLGIDRDYDWSKEDDKILKNLYPTKDNEVVAEKLKRTVSAIRNRAVTLKIKKSNRYWSPAQQKYILENYGKIPIEEMIKELKKTRWGIINKYRELSGLRKTKEKIIISKILE